MLTNSSNQGSTDITERILYDCMEFTKKGNQCTAKPSYLLKQVITQKLTSNHRC